MDSNLGDVLMPVAIIGSGGFFWYIIIKSITDYILKKKMIEKGYVNEEVQAMFKSHKVNDRYTSLKWGLIILFAGLSLILMEFIPYEPESPLPYGLFAVSIAIGFLIYYYLIKKEMNPKEDQ